MPGFLAPLITAGASLIGGMFDNDRDEDIAQWNTDVQRQINQENIAQQSHWNQVAINEARWMNDNNQNFTREMDALNYARQMDAANNSILWRVQDAQRAGVHPLFALGGGGASISPSMLVGGGQPGAINTSGASVAPAPRSPTGSSIGAAVRAMGQDLSRSVASTQTREERQEAQELRMYDRTIRHQNIDRGFLENQKLQAEIARLGRDQIGSPAASVSAKPGAVVRVPSQSVVGSKNDASREPGEITDYQYQRRSDGGLNVVQSEDMKRRTEDELPAQLDWWWRNRIAPSLTPWNKRPTKDPDPKEYPLPKGYTRWKYDWWRDGYFPSK